MAAQREGAASRPEGAMGGGGWPPHPRRMVLLLVVLAGRRLHAGGPARRRRRCLGAVGASRAVAALGCPFGCACRAAGLASGPRHHEIQRVQRRLLLRVCAPARQQDASAQVGCTRHACRRMAGGAPPSAVPLAMLHLWTPARWLVGSTNKQSSPNPSTKLGMPMLGALGDRSSRVAGRSSSRRWPPHREPARGRRRSTGGSSAGTHGGEAGAGHS